MTKGELASGRSLRDLPKTALFRILEFWQIPGPLWANHSSRADLSTGGITMIISHRHKFIFLRTTKTASTSMEISLSRFCGPEDVITPINPLDEPVRSELGIVPQNYTRPRKPWEFRPKDIVRYLLRKQWPEKILYWNHMPAQLVRERVTPAVWNSYFKFCFVRNPWDRAISRYYWNLSRDARQTNLNKSLRRNDPNSNFEIYAIDGKLAVDFVGKFENMQADLQKVYERLNLPFDGWLPRTKAKSRVDKRHYSDLLSPKQAEYIRQKCRQEIEFFNYAY